MTWNKSGVSAAALARSINISRPTTWQDLHRFREAMYDVSQRVILSGEVEVDEAFIGGDKGVSNKHCVVIFAEKERMVLFDLRQCLQLQGAKLRHLCLKQLEILQSFALTPTIFTRT
jgi:hypothetical protein